VIRMQPIQGTRSFGGSSLASCEGNGPGKGQGSEGESDALHGSFSGGGV
jgi:hypothetical protein